MSQHKDWSSSVRDFWNNTTSEIQSKCFQMRLWRKDKPKEQASPLGLSTDQLDSLRQLRSTQGWRHWEQALEALYKNETARLVGGLPHDEYLVVSGRVQTLETIYNLIDTLETQERHLNEHKRKPRTADPAHRALAFSGSPWYGLTSKP